MINCEYAHIYQRMCWGIKLAKHLKVEWYGQPAGICIGSDIIQDKLNFILNWLTRGIRTTEEIMAITAIYKETMGKPIYSIVGEGDDIDWIYSFSEEEYESVKTQFLRIYEANVPEYKR